MDFNNLKFFPLFKEIRYEDLILLYENKILRNVKFNKSDYLIKAGDPVQNIGIIISGSINIEYIDYWGNKSILNHLEASNIFGESYVCSKMPSMISAVAAENTEVLFLCLDRMLYQNKLSPVYPTIIQNLLFVTAQKNLELSRKIFFTSSKTIRGKLLTYLSYLSSKQDDSAVIIPFDRQQLADYLCTDRSALSAELSRMKRDGLIDYSKNKIIIKKDGIR